MQVFRLMGLPDRVIAFDELPEHLLEGIEMIRAEGFPNYWKKWMGTKKIVTRIAPERDAFTGARRTFDPIIDEDSFFYLIDWSLKPVIEKWKTISEYVRLHVSPDYRLMDKLEDMAKPLAPDKTSGITLEPDDVIVIPLPKETPGLVDSKGKDVPRETLKCQEEGCKAEFDGSYAKAALRFHVMKKHKKEFVSGEKKEPVSTVQ